MWKARALALALGAADSALLDHRVDLGPGVAEFAQDLGGVLAEFRRQAPQARLAAVEPDRRRHALVPILLDNIAARDRVRVGQCLVDLLHGAGGQARGEQAIAQRLSRTRAEPARTGGR